MKKFYIILTTALFAVSTFAQTEKGALRISGASSLNFTNTKYKEASGSTNVADLGIGIGYFFINNLSADLTVAAGYEKASYQDNATTSVGAELGLRYYLPFKVFAGAGFEYLTYMHGSSSTSASAANFKVGYAAFLNDNIAIEPAVVYRMGLGLTDEMKGNQYDNLSVQIGFSLFF